MTTNTDRIRVLYSFPHKLGADRICYTAWQQINGLHAAGAELVVYPGSVCRPVSPSVAVRPTLSRGKVRIPYRLLGRSRAYALHDYIVARRLEKLAGQIDIVHTWPQGARQTIKVAAKLGIPTVYERCNAHTRYGYEIVQKECESLGIDLPPSNESAYNENTLRIEEEEFRLADYLLCPSEFVVRTFLAKGFSRARLARHIYGFDEKTYFPAPDYEPNRFGLRMLFVGSCAVRKGVHYALDAWLRSPAHRDGTFTIAGGFLPDYAKKLAPMLSHPSVRVLGHRSDVAELMRNSDLFVLPSLEEGSALATYEARGSGCVLFVSDAAGAVCSHMENALIHRAGDVETLTKQITTVYDDRALLNKLRANSLSSVHEITWSAAGSRLLQVYHDVIKGKSPVGLVPLRETSS